MGTYLVTRRGIVEERLHVAAADADEAIRLAEELEPEFSEWQTTEEAMATLVPGEDNNDQAGVGGNE